jgi:glutaminyl-tRNA synthetase
MNKPAKAPQPASTSNFIRQVVEQDLASKKHAAILTRFPPEPNGYLHFGHAKSICLNFGLAEAYGGRCNLRFDDTNPEKEEQEYVDSIIEMVKWLGFDFGKDALYASDYFDFMYQAAEYLITSGNAYVDSQAAEEMRASRGTLTEAGKDSPYRSRSPEENLRLFREMRDGKHPDGAMVLRAKIDMRSPNINMRDPAIYRIKRATHHRTGDKWCIYPMYTYAHPIEDAVERITHSICTLEFEDQRPF